MLKSMRPLVRIATVLCVVGIAVAGCGRKGDLDRPGTPVERQNLQTEDSAAETVPDRPFLLDPLL